MNVIGWTALGTLGVLYIIAVCKWGYWQGQATEWKARAEVRGETIDGLYAERRESARGCRTCRQAGNGPLVLHSPRRSAGHD